MLTEHEQLCQSGLWRDGPTDVLSVIGKARQETHHSAIIAWLLTPTGEHGLGTRFLSAVLSSLFPDDAFASLSLARAACEVYRPSPDTRADIVVWAPSFTLIIENKIDAYEQPAQCQRLYQHFKQEKNARFCFLTPCGYTPTTDLNGAFKCLSYVSLRGLLQSALDASEIHAPGRATALSYLQTLKREFP